MTTGRGIVTAGVGTRTTAHLNLTGRTMADVWGPLLADQFTMRQPRGGWLHESGTRLTADARFRWQGDRTELRKLRESLDFVKGLKTVKVA